MNSNNKILIAAGIITLGLAVSSCKKDQDWSTDASHNRAFSVKDDISVDQADTSAEIIFKTRTTGTYTIELATDTLYDDIEEGTAAGSQTLKTDFTSNKEIHATSCVLRDARRWVFPPQWEDPLCQHTTFGHSGPRARPPGRS